jgi:hypothetical protein
MVGIVVVCGLTQTWTVTACNCMRSIEHDRLYPKCVGKHHSADIRETFTGLVRSDRQAGASRSSRLICTSGKIMDGITGSRERPQGRKICEGL